MSQLGPHFKRTALGPLSLRVGLAITTFARCPNQIVIPIVDSLKKGLSWDQLTEKFSSAQINNSSVEQVLLNLKEPADAKRALGFFHWSASRNQSQHQISNYAIAIHILVKAKLIKDARALLESALTKAPLSDKFSFVDSLIGSYEGTNSIPLVFDLLIQTYAKLRFIDLGYEVCQRLGDQGFTLSVITYNALIHVAQKSDKTALVWKIYEHMIRKRRYPNEITIRITISALCKEGKLLEYVHLLDRICIKRCSPSVIVNASLVFRVLEEGRVDEGLTLMKRMLQKEMISDTISYSLVVYARVRFGSIQSAYEVYEEMLNRGFQANSFVCTLFIGAYCKEERIEDAIQLMQEMRDAGLKPYSETFDHLIVGCSNAGKLEESMKILKEMMGIGLLPSCLAFNEMVAKLCEIGCVKEANDMLTKLLDEGFKPDEVTYAWLINGYAKEKNVKEVLKLYYEMEYKAMSPDRLVFEPLISCLRACGKLAEAEKYLKIMKDRSIPPS